MKYGIEKTVGNEVRLTEVVAAPDPLPSWAATDADWLAKQFPTLTGFVQVPEDKISGAVKQQDGGYINPTIQTPPAIPKKLTSVEFQDYCIAQLGAVAVPDGSVADIFGAGAIRYGEIISAVRTSTAAIYKTAEERYNAAVARDAFGKSDTGKFLALIAADMHAGETEAIMGNWPTE